jgi:predicted amidohydrolase YtcJ
VKPPWSFSGNVRHSALDCGVICTIGLPSHLVYGADAAFHHPSAVATIRRMVLGRTRPSAALSACVIAVAFVTGCAPTATNPPASPSPSTTGSPEQTATSRPPTPVASPSSVPTPVATATASPQPTATGVAAIPGNLVIVGRIVTMDEPAVAEALLIEDGTVAAVGTRAEIVALAAAGTPVIDIGQNVAYPGFIDPHAHWIGDRANYGAASTQEAMHEALVRGWTSISEQWVDQGRLSELESLARSEAIPLRVDGYLALNGLAVGDYYGDWYADRQPGAVDDHLRVRGLKIHLDSGTGAVLYWDTAHLNSTIRRANDAGWQVSVHAVSTEAIEMVLDAFEAAIGPNGPNPLHHRIEHALQVTDDQLARMVAMDLVPVIQLDGAPVDWVTWAGSVERGDQRNDMVAENQHWLARWKDFVDAGLHVAASSDAPWFFPISGIADDLGRPVDQIAGGMDGRGQVYPTPDWMLDQLLTADQVLRGVTVEAAYALGDEARRGHLATGTLGDVTILSGDVLQATPDEIRAFRVIATIVNGEILFCSATEVCGTD